MRRALVALALAVSLTACQSLDARVGKVNAGIQRYCTWIAFASAIATDVTRKKLAKQIDTALAVYCQPGNTVTDVPSALVVLAGVYKALSDAEANNDKLPVAPI